MNLPTGTVTFLFTDIEGSAKLWDEHPDTMRAALACHDAILQQAIEDNNGSLIKTLGDGVLAVFAAARDALRAVLSAQQTLHAQPWPEATPLCVRMALHTGEAEERNGDYFGGTLNRAARLMAIGHGG